jgi:hypothetical protein
VASRTIGTLTGDIDRGDSEETIQYMPRTAGDR